MYKIDIGSAWDVYQTLSEHFRVDIIYVSSIKYKKHLILEGSVSGTILNIILRQPVARRPDRRS